jgi:hypothetical protein
VFRLLGQRRVIRSQERDSSETPKVNALCRVAPVDRLRDFAIFAAGVLLPVTCFVSFNTVPVYAGLHWMLTSDHTWLRVCLFHKGLC